MSDYNNTTDSPIAGGIGTYVGAVTGASNDIVIPAAGLLNTFYVSWTTDASPTNRIIGIRYYNSTKATQYWEVIAWLAQTAGATWHYNFFEGAQNKTSSTTITIAIPQRHFCLKGEVIQLVDFNNVSAGDSASYSYRLHLGRP